LCCGTPVVVPTAGGAGDLAAPDFAETYPPGDAAAAAEAILRMLARDRTAASHAAAEAGQRIGDIEAHFEKLFALYEGAAAAKRVGVEFAGAHGPCR
jgi:alpha-1,6-mannosyltransferase